MWLYKSMSFMPLFIVTILGSSMMCIIFNSWVMIWIMLEINTLSFCYLMKDFSLLKKKSMEMSMKYFIIQSISSSLLLFTILLMKNMNLNFYITLLFFSFMSLLIKMASAPFQQWFINMVKNIKWKNNLLLMTWQKIAPVYLILYQMKFFLFPFIILCFFIGCILQLNKKNTMEIMAFSSVFNLGWMLMSILMNMKSMILFSVLYWISVFFLLFTLINSNFFSISKQSNIFMKKWMYFMIVINLAGIPPLVGFMSKWIVFSEALIMKFLILTTFSLVASSLNLYIYMRMFNYLMLSNSSKLQKSTKKMKNMFMTISSLMSIFPILFLL